MSELHILDAGRADCNVLLLDTQDGPKTVVIDGGTLRDCGSPLISFLREREIESIDLLVLTHLHQDHFGGFADLVGCIDVRRAVLPCDALDFSEKMYAYYAEAEDFHAYNRFVRYLHTSGATVCGIESCIGKTFAFGEYALHCLFPTAYGQQPAVVQARRMCDPAVPWEEQARACALFQAYCNADSSIWSLYRGEAHQVLFAADSTIKTMNEALKAMTAPPEVLKLSHHGIGACYFSASQIERISPKTIVVPTEKEYYTDELASGLLALCAQVDAELCCTFNGGYHLKI